MTIKRASFHEREDNIKERNLKNALRSNDLDHLLEYTEDDFDDEEDYRWK
jgi:hypothetical protein